MKLDLSHFMNYIVVGLPVPTDDQSKFIINVIAQTIYGLVFKGYCKLK